MPARVPEQVTVTREKGEAPVTITPVRTTRVGRTVDPSSTVHDAPARPPLPPPAAVLPRISKSTTGHVTVGNQQLRVDVRAGDGTGTPLVMCCGIGASFEVLQPLVDALDPGIDIIRFDAPGVGGSAVGALPNGFPQLARMLDRLLDELV